MVNSNNPTGNPLNIISFFALLWGLGLWMVYITVWALVVISGHVHWVFGEWGVPIWFELYVEPFLLVGGLILTMIAIVGNYQAIRRQFNG